MFSHTEYKPYTYFIGWTKSNQWYYGCEYANNTEKVANPSNFWKTYFTSSKKVKELRETIGEPDIIKVHKIFVTKKDALAFEEKFLRSINALKSDKWINMNIGGKNFCPSKESIEKAQSTRRKLISEGKIKPHRMIGKENPNYGRKWTQEMRDRMSKLKKGKSLNISNEERINRSKRASVNGKKAANALKEFIWITDKITKKSSKIKKDLFDPFIHSKGRLGFSPHKK